MAFGSTHGWSMCPCSAKNAQLTSSKPFFDAFDDLVHPSADAVCEVLVQFLPTDALQTAAYKASPFVSSSSSSRRQNSSDCAAQQFFCLPSAKQHIKARRGGMLTSIKARFSKLYKVCKGRGTPEANGISGTGLILGSEAENAHTGRPDLGMIDLVGQMEHQWSYTSSNISRCSSNSSDAFLNFGSLRSSSSSSSSFNPRSGSDSSACETPTGSTHSPRQSLSRDSAYEGNGSNRGNASHKITFCNAFEHKRLQYQQQHEQDEEGYGNTYRPMFSHLYQDHAADVELRNLQLARAAQAEQELQDWVVASRGWRR